MDRNTLVVLSKVFFFNKKSLSIILFSIMRKVYSWPRLRKDEEEKTLNFFDENDTVYNE